MSNFICPTCGFNNIDCGKDGYKTAREIELEKKLDACVVALDNIIWLCDASPSITQIKLIAEDALKK